MYFHLLGPAEKHTVPMPYMYALSKDGTPLNFLKSEVSYRMAVLLYTPAELKSQLHDESLSFGLRIYGQTEMCTSCHVYT